MLTVYRGGVGRVWRRGWVGGGIYSLSILTRVWIYSCPSLDLHFHGGWHALCVHRLCNKVKTQLENCQKGHLMSLIFEPYNLLTYCKRGNFRMGIIFALLSSSRKLPPRKNKTHMPLWMKQAYCKYCWSNTCPLPAHTNFEEFFLIPKGYKSPTRPVLCQYKFIPAIWCQYL